MKKDLNPPPALNGKALYDNAYRWMTGSEEDWQEGQRYLDAHQNAFATLPSKLRYDLAAGPWLTKKPLRFKKLQRALMAGCRWDDKLEGAGAGNKWSNVWAYINHSHAIFSPDCHHSAAEWLELFRLGGGVPLETPVEIPEGIITYGVNLLLWQALAVKAQEDAYHGRAKPQLSLILTAAKAEGVPVEGASEATADEIDHLSMIFWFIAAERDDVQTMDYMRLAHKTLMEANVDVTHVWESGLANDKSPEYRRLCETEGRALRTALLSGKSQAAEKDVREITCLGQLPQLVRGATKAGVSEELLQACDNLPPYYRQKYRHTIASLPRVMPVEESALSGYARGGVA